MSEWWVDESQLKGNQLDVLDVDLGRDLAIFGPPGSGKTNLMMLRANHLNIVDNPEFYVVTYTSLLAEFMRRGAAQYSFPGNKIRTQTKLFEMVLGDHGRTVERSQNESFTAYQDRLFAAMTELIAEGKAKNSFPALFIDEAQDYNQAQLQVFRHLAKNVTLAADVRQGIYRTDAQLDQYIRRFCDPVISLKYHFRTGKNIIAVADKIMDGKFDHIPMLDTSQYSEESQKSTVEVEDPCPLEDQIDKAIDRLSKQLRVYPNELLGVLVPRKDELAKVWDRIRFAPALAGKVTNTKSRDFDPSCPIWVTTIHSAKGLEFRCVHVLSSERIDRFNERARRLAFTAVTRAKTALVVYHHEDLLPFFSAALRPGSAARVSRSQLFGKKA